MSIHKAQALVVGTRNFRETSMIASFFSKEFGKFHGILKGIRTDPKKFASTLDTFSHNEVVFYRSRSSTLHLVSHCELKEIYPSIRKNLGKIGTANVMMELIDIIMQPEDAQEDIFALTVQALKELESYYDFDKIKTIYKIKLLAMSGFKPHFDSCVSCAARLNGESRFSLSRGGLLCGRCQAKDSKARAIFRGTIASILYIERNDLKTSLNLGLNPLIKRELNYILDEFLKFHLGKELRSQRIAGALNKEPVTNAPGSV